MPRILLVGDVHGCIDELKRLLEKVNYSSSDKLVFLGDLIARGPDSLAVLNLARQTWASVVRGNHEEKLLRYRQALAQNRNDVNLSRMHLDVYHSLSELDWKLLESSEVWLDFPEHDLRAIHGGIDPSIPFVAQDRDDLLYLRVVGEPPVLWGEHYVGGPHIVFGHHAMAGLQLHPWATGLDTACVYGGELSALVLEQKEPVPQNIDERKAHIFSVRAKRRYFEIMA